MTKLEPDLSEFLPDPRRCKIARFIEGLEDQERVNLEGAVRERRVTVASILAWLDARGLHASDKAVKAHRNGTCCCEHA